MNISGQSTIPQGIITRCYTNENCAGAVNEEFSQLFDSSMDNSNHCCYELRNTVNTRTNPEMLH